MLFWGFGVPGLCRGTGRLEAQPSNMSGRCGKTLRKNKEKRKFSSSRKSRERLRNLNGSRNRRTVRKSAPRKVRNRQSQTYENEREVPKLSKNKRELRSLLNQGLVHTRVWRRKQSALFQDFLLLSAGLRVRGRFQNPRQTPPSKGPEIETIQASRPPNPYFLWGILKVRLEHFKQD